MKTLLNWVNKYIPIYAIIPVICIFVYQSSIYFGTKLVNHNLHHYDLTTSLDEKIPLLPVFSIIYLGCYIFWALNYLLVGRTGKKHFYQFVSCIFISYTLCGLIFIIFPTMIERPDIKVTSLSTALLNYVYVSDTPVNLFPSMHCLISWLCFIGIRNKKEIPRLYQIISLIIAILVCISTVTLKQHFVVDIIAGILIAELIYFISTHSKISNTFYHFFESINSKVNLK